MFGFRLALIAYLGLGFHSNLFADCTNLQYAKKDETDARTGRRNGMENTQARYILEGFLARVDLPQLTVDSQGNLNLPCAALSSQAQILLDKSTGAISYSELENAWSKFLLNGFADLNYASQLPGTHDEFLRVTGYRNWRHEIVKESLVKQKTRIIYRSPEGVSPRIRVADTHDDRKGDPTTPVRETEIALERPDGNWDFFVYDKHGEPAQYSEFPSGHKMVPSICMGCHYDLNGRKMNRLFAR